MNNEQLREHKMTHDKSNSWWAHDVKGIPLCRVCDECEEASLSKYRPEVTGRDGCSENAAASVMKSVHTS